MPLLMRIYDPQGPADPVVAKGRGCREVGPAAREILPFHT